MNKVFNITVDNSAVRSHNVNIDFPSYFCFAQNKEEAVGKMMLSNFEHKNKTIKKIQEL